MCGTIRYARIPTADQRCAHSLREWRPHAVRDGFFIVPRKLYRVSTKYRMCFINRWLAVKSSRIRVPAMLNNHVVQNYAGFHHVQSRAGLCKMCQRATSTPNARSTFFLTDSCTLAKAHCFLDVDSAIVFSKIAQFG